MPVKFECFNLVPFIHDIYEQFISRAKARGVGLTFEHADNEIMAEADKDLMSRVVNNLINNALKHTRSHITVFIEKQDTGIILCVADDGPGIPEKYKEKIFDKYFQIEESNEQEKYGAGLGLAFCNLAVKAQNGKIWVERTDKNKTCFKVRLKSSAL